MNSFVIGHGSVYIIRRDDLRYVGELGMPVPACYAIQFRTPADATSAITSLQSIDRLAGRKSHAMIVLECTKTTSLVIDREVTTKVPADPIQGDAIPMIQPESTDKRNSIRDTLVTWRTEAMRSRDESKLSISRYLLGRFDQSVKATDPDPQPVSDKQAEQIIRSLLKDPISTFTAAERCLMEQLIPRQLTRKEIWDLLTPVKPQICQAKNAGQANGVAMKALAGQPVDGNVVVDVVEKMCGGLEKVSHDGHDQDENRNTGRSWQEMYRDPGPRGHDLLLSSARWYDQGHLCWRIPCDSSHEYGGTRMKKQFWITRVEYVVPFTTTYLLHLGADLPDMTDDPSLAHRFDDYESAALHGFPVFVALEIVLDS